MQQRGPEGEERGRDGGGGGVRDVNHKLATSAGNWMALICISSCIIHQHHFTTVRNITFILQMLIYVKQLILRNFRVELHKRSCDIYFLLSAWAWQCVCWCLYVRTYPSRPYGPSVECVCVRAWTVCLDFIYNSHMAAIFLSTVSVI